MRIGIDASKLVSPKPTGVERSTQLLLKNLFDLDQENEYLLFAPVPLKNFEQPNVKSVVVPPAAFWTLSALPSYLEAEKAEIFFQPGNILPTRLPRKVVMTIHDLATIKLPRLYSLREVFRSYLSGLQAARRASKIVAVSQATKEDIKRFFAVPERKIEVIHHGPPRGYLRRTGKLPNQVGKDFFLVVGRMELRKNIIRILEAYSLYRKLGGGAKLVFVGPVGFGYDQFQKKMKELSLDRVVILGFADDRTMSGLLTYAKALFFPSLYEGFGLPILEAFTYGLPVVTSNLGATKEVARDAALLVNPYIIDELAHALKQVEDDKKLRELLIARGKKRLQDFSWVKAAQKLRGLFESL